MKREESRGSRWRHNKSTESRRRVEELKDKRQGRDRDGDPDRARKGERDRDPD